MQTKPTLPSTTETAIIPAPELPLDKLDRRDGNNMGTITGDRVTAATRELPEDQREAVRWLFSISKQMGWSLTQLKQETGIDDTTLFRVFTGTYPTDPARIIARIASYRATYEDRSKALRAGKVFVETSMVKSIWDVCDYASATNTMAMIYGPSQFGKTWALEEYQARHNHGQTKMVRMPGSAGVQLAMKEFARACYVSPNSCFDQLREKVLRAIDSHNLIIIDELHEVFLSYQRGAAVKCLEVIREIHDRTGCGMVLCGTQRLKNELLLGEHKDLLAQFVRRTIATLTLPKEIPWADIEAIAAAYGLPAPTGQSAKTIRLLIKDKGLKSYAVFLSNAHNIAKKSNRPMTWNHFIKAHDLVANLSIENQ
jgi:DNA transposition AAA+ family ATPase